MCLELDTDTRKFKTILIIDAKREIGNIHVLHACGSLFLNGRTQELYNWGVFNPKLFLMGLKKNR